MLPYLTLFFTINVVGVLADLMKRIKIGKYKMSVVFVRKFFQTVSFLGSSLFYFLLSYAENSTSATILVCVAVMFCSLSKSGYWVNHIDIGPSYAGPLMGITNTFGAIPGAFANVIAGYILQWTGSFNYVFYCIIAIQLFGCLVFLIVFFYFFIYYLVCKRFDFLFNFIRGFNISS
jgi:MFS transporter, ACS family, solute carrier family 17 (sodium-dependent inorganic phosphate cotransporter), member 5